MSKKKKKTKLKEPLAFIKTTQQEIANARVLLADSILSSDNTEEILYAINELLVTQVEYAYEKRKSGKKKESQKWSHSAQEFHTVLMCAIYRSQESQE